MSRLIAGGNHEMEAGGSGQRGKPTNADRLKQARILYDQMHQKAERLEQELENLKEKKPGQDLMRRTGDEPLGSVRSEFADFHC